MEGSALPVFEEAISGMVRIAMEQSAGPKGRKRVPGS
jgi:hypothetical protein